MTPAENTLEELECRICWYTLHLIQCGPHYALLAPANDLAVVGGQPETGGMEHSMFEDKVIETTLIEMAHHFNAALDQIYIVVD